VQRSLVPAATFRDGRSQQIPFDTESVDSQLTIKHLHGAYGL